MEIEWVLVSFTLFTGLSVGTFLGVTASEWSGKAGHVRLPGAIMALVTLAAGGFSAVLHLGHPERIFGALGHPTSGIFVEALMVGLFGLDIIAYLISIGKDASSGVRKAITTIGIVVGIMLTFAVGHSYVMPSRPAWNTLLLPILYVASAVVLGCFSLRVLDARKAGGTTSVVLNRVTATALGIQALLLIAYLGHIATAPYWEPSRSVTRILIGNLAPLFWIGIVAFGLLLPVQLIRKQMSVVTSFAASVLGLLCVFLAGGAFRVLMFAVGSSVRHFF